ncbi:hypothetical protein [Escherichia coli]|nr:hypothetical protein [Escherichia coli]
MENEKRKKKKKKKKNANGGKCGGLINFDIGLFRDILKSYPENYFLH